METLFDIHSHLRWIVLLAAAATVIRLALGVIRRETTYAGSSRVLMMVFSTVIDIQITLGIVYFIWHGAKYDFWPRYRFEHGITLLIAAFILHLAMRWRKSPAPVRYRNELLVVLAALLVIGVGVARLPQIDDTNRWFYTFLRMHP